jgi:hypothetical protein
MDWIVEEVPELKGYTVEWAEEGNYYLSRRNRLYRSADLKPPFDEIATIDAPAWKALAAHLRLAQRLLRFMVTNVLPLPNGELFVTFDKSVGVVRSGKYQALKGLERPCRVLRSACAVDSNRDVYFGEYLANVERGEMRIYKYSPGSDHLEVVHTFPPGSIKHIHGIYFDEFTNALFCLTGDDEQECQILRSVDGFKTVQVVGRGDETWRAVSMLFDRDHIYYGTDAEFSANHIYRVERETLVRQILGEVNGTVFYSKRIGDDLFFTTTAENAPAQKENVAAVWHVDGQGNCRELIKFKKDRWHKALFMFGTIHFPAISKNTTELYFHLVGVEGDNRSFRLRRNAPSA